MLATHYHLIAPDFPGFGHSDAPPPPSYAYSFDHLAQTTDHLLEALAVERYSLFIHDYGAPVGMRLALAHPERLQALIVSNGNVFEAGLGAKWRAIAQYWADPAAHRAVIDAFLSPEATRLRHIAGTAHPERYDPDTWTDEIAHLARPGQRAVQSELLYDYRTNVAAYPAWQAWLRQHQPPTLVVWGCQRPVLRRGGRHQLPDGSTASGNPSAGRGSFRAR